MVRIQVGAQVYELPCEESLITKKLQAAINTRRQADQAKGERLHRAIKASGLKEAKCWGCGALVLNTDGQPQHECGECEEYFNGK